MLSPRVPDLSALELLLAVAQEGSIGRAAIVHGISQPAASARLQNMERLLGFAVIDRGARGSRLTTRGALMAEWAHGVIDAAADLDAGIAALRSDVQARLVLAASLTVAEHLLPGWLARWHGRQLDVAVSLLAVNSADAARLVIAGEADLGFIEGPAVPAGLSSRFVANDRLVVVAAPDHPWTRRRRPLTAVELAGTALVVREPLSGTRTAFETALAGVGLACVAPVLQLSTSSAVRAAVVAGVGPAVLSNLAVNDDIAARRLKEIPLTGLELHRTLRAIWSRGQQPTGPARDLLSLIGSVSKVR